MHLNFPGLVTCQEHKLLIDPMQWTEKKQQNLDFLMTHELAHMWWGDVITVDWWSYLWLKESFAQYYTYFGLDLVSGHFFHRANGKNERENLNFNFKLNFRSNHPRAWISNFWLIKCILYSKMIHWKVHGH